MNQLIDDYAGRLGLSTPLEPTLDCLRRLHEAHLYTVPFENFGMHRNAERGLGEEVLHEAIVRGRRGGICFETGQMMRWLFEACGFDHEVRLASCVNPTYGLGPATHQVFVVTVDGTRWLFDIGYGAQGPRGPFPLVDGEGFAHPALSTRVAKVAPAGEGGAPVWEVSIREHATGATEWREIYRFVDAPAADIDLEMAHFYTVASPNSLLNRHKVASVPTPTGRVSVRDLFLTVVHDGVSTTTPIADRAELRALLERHFGLVVPEHELAPAPAAVPAAAPAPAAPVPAYASAPERH
ncbi:arylamine N-acetyltransferase [Streptomyces sp. NPDC048606]|uniref:arylamine N-acetyltransferase family protein n=1 Tax=Streptomyces sp. NPDC048606 TaxID=3154726 RepID=UPI003448B4F1